MNKGDLIRRANEKFERLLEKQYNLDLTNSTSDQNYEPLSNRSERLRLRNLILSEDQEGDPTVAEKICEILLGGHNLNIHNRTYPLIDILIDNPIEGISEKGEMVSIKSSRKEKVFNPDDSNTWSISPMIYFMLKKIDYQQFDSPIFKERNAVEYKEVIKLYFEMVDKNLSFLKIKAESQEHNLLHMGILFFLGRLKNYLDQRTNNPKKNKTESQYITKNLWGDFVTQFFKLNARSIINDLKSGARWQDVEDLFPASLKKEKISWAWLWFDADDVDPKIKTPTDNKQFTVNIRKSVALPLLDVVQKSFQRIAMTKDYKQQKNQESLPKIFQKKIHANLNKKDMVWVFEQASIASGIALIPSGYQGKSINALEKHSLSGLFPTHIRVVVYNVDRFHRHAQSFQRLNKKADDNVITLVDKLQGLSMYKRGQQVNAYIRILLDEMEKMAPKQSQQLIDNFKKFLSQQYKAGSDKKPKLPPTATKKERQDAEDDRYIDVRFAEDEYGGAGNQ